MMTEVLNGLAVAWGVVAAIPVWVAVALAISAMAAVWINNGLLDRTRTEVCHLRKGFLDEAIHLASDTHRAAAATLMLKQLRRTGSAADPLLQPELGLLELCLVKRVPRSRVDPDAEPVELPARIDDFVRKWNLVRSGWKPGAPFKVSAAPPAAACGRVSAAQRA